MSEAVRLSPKQVADRWGVNSSTVVDMIDSGRLPAIDLAKAGSKRRMLRVLVADVEQVERASRCAPAAPHPKRAKQYRMKHLHA